MAGEERTEFGDPADRTGGHDSHARTSIRRLGASVLFLIGLAGLLGLLHFVLVPSNGTEWWWGDYLELTDNSLDVVNVGNSHLQCSVAPMQLWRDYGIASWNLTSGGINSATKFAYVKEALKTQRPHVLTLEVHSMDFESISTPQRNQDAYSFMPWSLDKLQAILTTATPDEWGSLLLRLLAHHQRYADLTMTDFDPREDVTRLSDGGAYPLSTQPTPGGEVEARNAIPWRIDEQRARENLRFIELVAEECESRDVQLIVWLAPVQDGYTGEADPVRWIESELADNHPEVAFINSNYHHVEIGLDSTDFRDRGHLYAWGMTKTTEWLAESVLAGYVEPSGSNNPDADWWSTQAGQWAPLTYEEAAATW